ncbi:MAG: hypothetical protein Q9168_005703 [Polycauliona sp. 1 TL-2023]
MPPSTGLTITNPLVLYRTLLATKKIDPDPAQHRLALHLQKIYYRLKDYEPLIDYKYELDRVGDAVRESKGKVRQPEEHKGRRSIFSLRGEHKEHADVLALTRKLTSHESAVRLHSPQGLLLYGEVGTGKSMLVDLLAGALPNQKKGRWHFDTFMLQTFAKLEQQRRHRLSSLASQDQEHSLLWLARDLISTSPILFLDEFQLPDRAASKILSNLLTSFFHLGGVLVATSNRMPEELAKASGVEFAAPPPSPLGILRRRWAFLGSGGAAGNAGGASAAKSDFASFLEVLRARCEIWDMEGGKDWRRRETEDDGANLSLANADIGVNQGIQAMSPGHSGLGYEQSTNVSPHQHHPVRKGQERLPKFYFVHSQDSAMLSSSTDGSSSWDSAVLRTVPKVSALPADHGKSTDIPWQETTLRVYGRNLQVPRHMSGVTLWDFDELCTASLGPADYITLASTFHTFILENVPILTSLHKNEARRFITLLDALYEARCKLLVRSAAGPDGIFFPEDQQSASSKSMDGEGAGSSDGVYPETFSEIYQDQTSPFRPNISSYSSTASPPSYDSSPLASASLNDAIPARSILADEDSDFGPTYGTGRSAGSRYRGTGDGIPGAGNEIGHQSLPNFATTGAFTGEDERFAYKRAQSRLWELCGSKWWAREGEGWWQPLGKELRKWERGLGDAVAHQADAGSENKEANVKDDTLFRHGASPFRTSPDPPPKISWTHAWGMMKWGKKAGQWGQGPEGLEKRGEGIQAQKKPS